MSLSPQKVDFEGIWQGLAVGVRNIVTLTGVQGMPMVEDIYKLCTAQPQPYSEELYLRLKQFLEQHVDGIRETILSQQSDILENYLRQWEAYSTGTEYTHHIFRYLNNNWIRKRLEDSRNKLGGLYQGPSSTTEVYEVMILALVIWRDNAFAKLKDRLLRALLELITRERDGEVINSTVLAGVINSFVKLGLINKNKPLEIYKEDFEEHYIAHTRDYYTRESAEFIAANGVSSYMKKAINRINEEAARAKKYLDSSSFEKIKKEVDSVLIFKHKELIQAECAAYLTDNKQEDLKNMYTLLSRIGDDGIKPMLETLNVHVTAYGIDAIKAIPAEKKEDATTYIETILHVYNTFDKVVKESFAQDSQFDASLEKAMRVIANDNPTFGKQSSTKSPELLAKYSDIILSKGNRNFDMSKLDETVTNIMTAWKIMDDRDVFMKFFSQKLAKRLIYGVSVSDDAETAMIGALKTGAGYEYTSKLQRMFNDMTLSSDINEKFKEYVEGKSLSLNKVDFNIQVLTAGSWPLQAPAVSFNIPQELESCVNHFTVYYNSQHHGRKLSWLHHMCRGDLKTFYLKKRYELQTSSYQMGILLMFNKAEQITVDEASNHTGLKDREMKRTVMSLLVAKILKKNPASKELKPTDVLTLNTRFASKRLRVKVLAGVQRETKEENKDTHQSIEEDRKLFLQAAIVRIMKARKTLSHNNLVQETIAQARSRFSPSVPMIKKCIGQLIEKEYLARVEGEANMYAYLA